MDLKNAVAVCLIAVVSATLVVLVARSLDNQAASRLEPQLAQIVSELRALRARGGVAPAAGDARIADTLGDGLIVYYFHGDIRCDTCEAIESQTHEVVVNDFADELESGEVTWKVLNYQKPATAALKDKFGVHMANVVLAKMDGDEIEDWKRLDEVWPLHGDKRAFAEFMREEIRRMLEEENAAEGNEEPATETPVAPTQDAPPVDLPLPE